MLFEDIGVEFLEGRKEWTPKRNCGRSGGQIGRLRTAVPGTLSPCISWLSLNPVTLEAEYFQPQQP